ncbi:HEAT repeat domain-containing protein [Spirosoma utsteinense]|uniref:Heme-binding domain-containing protein n=1 Tax=Spirosoma utsteinense TaxID=2585773 RepID=A0ABR6WC09_9BACT|nr:HEAT repeat domain-containing protein [Spirosoma utsteinense]MBC3788603.1 putative heme-binding domain-containing protein [Spirosoma utsteinense]MBC3794076.1 putative heme-binding domain-containing protein [Spirosoma utsteinense]
MKKFSTTLLKPGKLVWYSALVITPILVLVGFQDDPIGKRIKRMAPEKAAALAKSIETLVTPELAEGLSLKLWGVDSLVADPIAIDIDDMGRIYYTRTNRQKNSEFDIRSHQDWEIESNHLQTIEDKRAFLHRVLSPANSKKNEWLKDMNGDGSHDWRDMTVEKEQVFRLEDTSGDGVADVSQEVVNDFHDEVTDVAGGVLVDGNDLYVAVAPDLWRMRDKNGDGIADKKTSLSHGYGVHVGFGGHGMSGVEMGPDGKIYWQIGDIGFNGKTPDGKKLDYANSGVIVRSNPDGSDFEVFAHGVRNTHEFVFDEYANLISEDNDGDHPGEKERLVYIVNGSDTGWRSNWQYGKYRDPNNNPYKVWMDEGMYKPRFEGQAAYFTPTLANFVSGPSGMLYNPGTALSPAYRNMFFIAEFVGSPARSGIHAFKLKSKGASFELGEQKKILGNVLATGIDFGPDGAMYVADWINGWDAKDYGRIWKLDDKAGNVSAERQLTKKLLAQKFTSNTENELGDYLKNPDMRVRQKAQFELVKRGAKGAAVFSTSLRQTDNQLARVHSIWGISQLARKDKKNAQLLMPLLKDTDPEIRAQAAKWLGDIRYKEAGSALVPLLKDRNARAQFFAAEALGRIAYEPAIQPIIELLAANNDEDAFIRHAGSLALARIGKAEPVVALAKHPSKGVRIAAVVALRRMSDPGITAFLADSDEFVVTEAARAINDDHSIPAALPALGTVLVTTRFTNEPLIRRAINANLRVGTPEAMKQLIAYANKEGSPVAMRAEAMDALSTWAKPSVLDRVDGRYRREIVRDPVALKSSVAGTYIKLLSHSERPLRMSAVKAVSKLKLTQAEDELFGRLKNDTDVSVRVEALRALAALNSKEIGKAIEQALSDSEKNVRVAALDLVGKTAMAKDKMVSLLSDVINTRTTEEKQAALLTLGTLPIKNTQPVFDQLLAKMAARTLPAEIGLELEEAVASTHSAPLIARHKAISGKLSPDDLLASYQGSLSGGEPEQGRRIFFRHQTAQCIRCHSYDDLGGNAGPRLNGVASRLSHEQLLEAVINPSARLAPGFGSATLELKDGKIVSGIVQNETATEVIMKVGDQPDAVIRKDQISKRTNAPSSMPDMKYLLTKREIRDVVSFLSTLKDERESSKK